MTIDVFIFKSSNIPHLGTYTSTSDRRSSSKNSKILFLSQRVTQLLSLHSRVGTELDLISSSDNSLELGANAEFLLQFSPPARFTVNYKYSTELDITYPSPSDFFKTLEISHPDFIFHHSRLIEVYAPTS